MAMHQHPGHCAVCGQSRVFVGNLREVNHAMHLLICLFCCGLWVPVWIIDVIMAAWSNASTTYNCISCGCPAGSVSGQQVVAEQTAAAWRAAAQAAGREEQRAKRAEKVKAAKAWLYAATTSGWAGLSRVPAAVDMGLRLAAGEGNTILYRFFQVVAYGLLPVVLLAISAWAIFG